MGNACAPSYANLYLGWWESILVFGDDAHWLTEKVGLWARYIDDIFILWQGTKEEFNLFVTLLNDNQCGLRFTSEIHTNHIPFLDVTISRGEGGRLNTTIYRKPTSTNSLLNWTSFHPVPLKRGIPYGQYLQLKRNCSTSADFQTQAKDLSF